LFSFLLRLLAEFVIIFHPLASRMKTILFTLLPALVAAGPGINPNPNPNFDPTTSQGTFGPFVPAQRAAPGATGGPNNVDVRSKQAMQLAMSNWMTDTGIVSGFQNIGQNTNDNDAFKGIADGAFKAEVDELAQKAVLDAVIGQDPRVSIANLTLTNGVFQSVVDNLQIMSLQGTAKSNLIDTINQVRCNQILPSIDTYMIVAAEYIGDNAQQRRAVRPAACTQILANSKNSDFPNVPVSLEESKRIFKLEKKSETDLIDCTGYTKWQPIRQRRWQCSRRSRSVPKWSR
jgi:hypothetical protein